MLAELTLTNTQDRRLQLAQLAAGLPGRPAASSANKFEMTFEEGMIAKRDVRYPHTIGFRITDKTWLRIEHEIAETDLTAHDWCRQAVLDRLDREYGFSKKERLLLHQVVRTHYLIVQGFQVLADDNLTTEEWKKIRGYANEKVDYFARLALEEFQSKTSLSGSR